MLDELAAQGTQENLSFFAFTATPKDKTLQMFGERDANGKYHPFHIYSMRQAIEEHFILDVLKNYMTYRMYYKIAKSIPDDPELDTTAGVRAIRQFETLHPHNISQKTAVMLEHFRNVTRHKIGGHAKAMIVTPSRLHAVRYLLEFKRQIEEKGYTDLDVLVAFSGEVEDNGITYTEEKLNTTKTGETIKEKALPAAFHTDEYGMLIVAEKYQTGFDEPAAAQCLLIRKLSGVKAVQTLSRLNRTMRGKVDTFVLDFVNSAEDIRKAFEPYYEETVLEEETDPNVIYDLKNTLDEFRVYQQLEIDRFAEIFYTDKEQDQGTWASCRERSAPLWIVLRLWRKKSRNFSSPHWLDLTESMLLSRRYAACLIRKFISSVSTRNSFIPCCPRADGTRCMLMIKSSWSIIAWKRTLKAESSWKAPRRASGRLLARQAAERRSATR